MVFSSVPVYQDPPNWNQQPVGGGENPHLPPPPPVGGGGGMGSTTPRSMTERARLAKLPQPETALNCPRCESTNTKFCYFNNYNLSQPRHFCKTCRRYWTRGGALRNVPVGGGCRRNKRSKRNKSKSPISVDRQLSAASSNSCTTNMLDHVPIPPPQLPFYGNGNIDLNFREIQPDFQIGSNSSGNGPNLTSQFEQWRLEQVNQFPFLAGMESTAGIYQFEGEGLEPSDYVGGATGHLEENQGLNLSRNFLGVPGNDDHYLGGNAWTTDLNGFTSSTSHLL